MDDITDPREGPIGRRTGSPDDSGAAELRIAELIASIAPFLDDVAAAEDRAAGRTVYRRGGQEIARTDGGALEVRLPEDIAEAAIRTPDTVALEGRPGWVRFAPTSAHRHVSDRAEAWFRTAWRHAGSSD